MNPNLPDSVAKSCLNDVQYRMTLDAFIFPENLTLPDLIYQYTEDWMGNGRLEDGYTLDEMLDAMLRILRERHKTGYNN